jgi:hypothetical protein
MNNSSTGRNSASHERSLLRRFRDFDVSWAGRGRNSGEFCFGSEDGKVLFTDEHLNDAKVLKESPLQSVEAINGLAFLHDRIGLSTRCEVVFVSQPGVNGNGFRSVFPAGAHGIIATASGYFVAPLGRSGLLIAKPSSGNDQPLTISRVSHKPINFYKVVHIPYGGGEVLAIAARLDGVAAMPFSSDGTGLFSSFTYPGLDVVDVCSLGQNLAAPAIAAVSRDCTLILSKDALYDPHPTTIKFDEFKGTAYRVLYHDGNLLLLTSRAVYLLAGLGRRFLNGEPVGLTPTPTKAIILEAVDANIGDQQTLLVVVPDGVIPIALDLPIGGAPSAELANEAHQATPTEMSPEWRQESRLESELMSVG